MRTQCPYCKSIFIVVTDELKIAQGHVRCGECLTVFNAANELLDSESFKTDPHYQVNINNIPNLLQSSSLHSFHSVFFWGFMVVLLSITLAGQVLWFWERDFVLQNPQLRPGLVIFCDTFLCELPPTRDLNSFQIKNQRVQLQSEWIEVEMTFINNATFSQIYPDLQLNFEDINGNIIAQQRFKPSDYLPFFPNKFQQMTAHASIAFKLYLPKSLLKENKVIGGYLFEFLDVTHPDS
jgi:predicted Zn finger-like uncharacterized protein